MGDRVNIALKYTEEDTKIYFYSHWGGHKMKEVLKQALIRGKPRWDDDSYLARIIFSEMIKDAVLEETGYGIAPYEIDPENPTIKVDLDKQTIDGKSFKDFIV